MATPPTPAPPTPVWDDEPKSPSIDHAAIKWDEPGEPAPHVAAPIGGTKLSANELLALPAESREKVMGQVSPEQYRALPIEHRIALTGFDPKQVMGSRLYRPEDWQIDPPSLWGSSPGAGFAAGLRRVADAFGQYASHGKADVLGTASAEGDKDYTDALAKFHEANFNQRQGRAPGEEGISPSRFLGQSLPIAVGLGPLGGVPGAVVGGAAAGAMSQPQETTPTTTPGEFWSHAATSATGGAMTGTAMHYAGGLALKGLGKGADWISGKMADPNSVQRQLLDKALKTPFEDMADVVAASKVDGPRRGAALELLKQADNMGMDMNKIMGTSLEFKALKAKLSSDLDHAALYSKVGGHIVDVEKPVSVIDKVVDDIEGTDGTKWAAGKKAALLDEVKQLRKELLTTQEVVPGGEVAPAPTRGINDLLTGNTPAATMAEDTVKETPNTFRAIDRTKSDLQDRLSKFYEGTDAETGKKGAANIQRIIGSLDDALETTADKAGAAEEYATAKSNYAKLAGTYHDPEIVKAMNSANPDEMKNAFIKAKGGGEDRPMRLYKALDAKGRAAFNASVFDDAMKEMKNADWPGGVKAFRDVMKRTAEARGVFLKGDDLAAVNGVADMMTFARNASAGSLPLVGAVLGHATPLGSAGMALTGGAGALLSHFGIATGPGAELVKGLLSNPAGKQYLIRLANSVGDEIGPKMNSSTARLLNNLEARLPQLMGRTAYNNMRYAHDVVRGLEKWGLSAITPTRQDGSGGQSVGDVLKGLPEPGPTAPAAQPLPPGATGEITSSQPQGPINLFTKKPGA